MKTIAFDDSGNTGSDLLNQDQPVFVLASSDYSIEEAEQLLSILKSKQAPEVKFSRLRSRSSGQRKILEIMPEILKNKERFITIYFHKEFMVITKIVDIIIEELAKKDGLDIYKRGANIAMSNVHYYSMPILCGEELTKKFYKSFIEMIKNHDEINVNTFFHYAWQLYNNCTNKTYQEFLAPILASREYIYEIIKGLDFNSLDPAIPAFFTHCALWGDKIQDRFNVLHDDSKPIFQEKDTLELVMTNKFDYKIIGYDRRKFTFPLRATGIEFCDSKLDPRLQLVDVIASCSGAWATGLVDEKKRDNFWDKLDQDLDLKSFATDALFPSLEVDPISLGTDEIGGIHAVDYMTEKLANIAS